MSKTTSSFDLLSPVWTHLTELQPVRGEGIYYYDAEGNRYTDFTSGIGVVNTGHCHPKVVAAIQEQANSLIFGQMNIVISPTTIATIASQAIDQCYGVVGMASKNLVDGLARRQQVR